MRRNWVPRANKGWVRRHRLFLAAGAIYLLVSCLYLSRPGLEYDEVLFGNAALGGLDSSFIAYQWTFGAVRVPVMLMNYIGAVKSALYTPIFAIFPTTAVTVRLPMVVAGFLTLILTYRLAGQIFNQRTALIAAWLLATDPSYIFQIRLDWGPVALMLLFKMGSLYCFVRFVQTRRLAYLAVGALAVGLGLYDKANFIWYLAALPVAALLAWRTQVLRWVTWRNAVVTAVFFLLGCWPLLVYNVVTHGATLEGQLALPTNWFDVAQHKAQVLLATLNGSAAYQFTNRSDLAPFFSAGPAAASNPPLVRLALAAIDLSGTWLPWGLVLALAVIGLLLVTKAAAARQAFVFFASLFALLLAEIYFTYNAVGPHHMIMVYPLPQLLIAASLVPTVREGFAFRPSPPWLKRTTIGARAVVLVALITTNLVVDGKYLVAFARDGGQGAWSDAIYTLADYTQQHKDQTYVLMDWGFNTQLLLLTRGTVARREVFWSFVDSGSENQQMDALYAWAQHPSVVFVFHTAQYTSFEHPRQIFDAMLLKFGFTAETVEVITQRNGDPIYILQRVVLADASGQALPQICFFYREAEQWDAVSGGARDLKGAASEGAALGEFWGQSASDFVTYQFLVPGVSARPTVLFLRVAFEGTQPQEYDTTIDSGPTQVIWLNPTGGWGYSYQEWALAPFTLGPIEPGQHRLTLRPHRAGSPINIDSLSLCDSSAAPN